jgi:hypothetical protein
MIDNELKLGKISQNRWRWLKDGGKMLGVQ